MSVQLSGNLRINANPHKFVPNTMGVLLLLLVPLLLLDLVLVFGVCCAEDRGPDAGSKKLGALGLLGVQAYMLPFLLSVWFGSEKLLFVFLLNAFGGWSVIGWFAALYVGLYQ